MDFKLETVDTSQCNDKNSTSTVGALTIRVREDGQPFATEAAAKSHLSYYQGGGQFIDYSVVPFATGWAFCKLVA